MKKSNALGELVKHMIASTSGVRFDQYAVTAANNRVVDIDTGQPHQGTSFRMTTLKSTDHDGHVPVVQEVTYDPSSIHDKLCVDFNGRDGAHIMRVMLPLEPSDQDLSFGYRFCTVKGGATYTSRVDHLSADMPVHSVGVVIKKLMSEGKLDTAQATAILIGFAAYHQHQETLRGSSDHTISERFKAAYKEMAAREEKDWQQKLQAERDFQTPRGV